MADFIALLPDLLQVVFWIAILGGGGYLLVRLVRESRGPAPEELAALENRVRELEGKNAQVEAEVAQLTDAQRFTTELLAERSTTKSE